MNNTLKLVLHKTLFYVKINIVSFFIYGIGAIPIGLIINKISDSYLIKTSNNSEDIIFMLTVIKNIICAIILLFAFYISFYRSYKKQENEARQFVKDNIGIEYNPKLCLKNHMDTKGKTDFIIFTTFSIISSILYIIANNVKELKNIGGVIAFLLACPNFAFVSITNQSILSLIISMIISIIIFILVYPYIILQVHKKWIKMEF